MSRALDKVVCTGCSYEAPEFHRPILIRYRGVDGTTVENRRSQGWCYQCDSYSALACLDRAELKKKISIEVGNLSGTTQRLEEEPHGLLSIFVNRKRRRMLRAQIEDITTEIARSNVLLSVSESWQSDGRCLECWSGKVARITFDSNSGFAHNFKHDCGGTLKLLGDPSGIRYRFNLSTYVVDHDGRLLTKE